MIHKISIDLISMDMIFCCIAECVKYLEFHFYI